MKPRRTPTHNNTTTTHKNGLANSANGLAKNGLAKIGLAKWAGEKLAKIGLTKVAFNLSAVQRRKGPCQKLVQGALVWWCWVLRSVAVGQLRPSRLSSLARAQVCSLRLLLRSHFGLRCSFKPQVAHAWRYKFLVLLHFCSATDGQCQFPMVGFR